MDDLDNVNKDEDDAAFLTKEFYDLWNRGAGLRRYRYFQRSSASLATADPARHFYPVCDRNHAGMLAAVNESYH